MAKEELRACQGKEELVRLKKSLSRRACQAKEELVKKSLSG